MKAQWIARRLRPRMGRRLAGLVGSICVMGVCVAAFKTIEAGTDPCSCMNLGISGRIGMSFGSWQVLLNALMLLAVAFLAPEMISVGTLVNMVCVGYIAEFFMGVFGALVPQGGLSLAVRTAVFVPTMAAFLLVAAVYTVVDLGFAPYDALPLIIARHARRLPFRAVRMLWDLSALTIGFSLGATVGVATLITGFCLGPAITAVGERVKGVFEEA